MTRDADATSEIPANWVSSEEAAKLLEVSVRSVHRFASRGKLRPRKDKTGAYFFDPSELDVLKPDPTFETSADVLRAAGVLLGQAADHNEELLEPNRELLKLLLDDKKIDRARILELEVRVQAMLAAAEKSLSEEHDRLLSRELFDAEQRRLDKGLDFIMTFAPLVQALVAKRFGLPETGEANAIAEFFGSFSPQEVMSMIQGLPQEKGVVIMGIYDQIVSRKKAANDAAEAAKKKTTNEAPKENAA